MVWAEESFFKLFTLNKVLQDDHTIKHYYNVHLYSLYFNHLAMYYIQVFAGLVEGQAAE